MASEELLGVAAVGDAVRDTWRMFKKNLKCLPASFAIKLRLVECFGNVRPAGS